MNSKKFLSIFLFVFVCLLGVKSSFAGGPINVSPGSLNGIDPVASVWDTNTITFHPEQGVCGNFTNAQMETFLVDDLDVWSLAVNGAFAINISGLSINVDINETNFTDYYYDESENNVGVVQDGINPIIFDDDGEILRALTGSSFSTVNRILGLAGPVGFTNNNDEEIVDAQVIINCRCLAGNQDCGNNLMTEDELHFTIIHEVGHAIGLDHCTVDGCTMYPSATDASNQRILNRDDEVTIQSLYDLSDLESTTCTVTGTLLDTNDNEIRCADVQAQPIDVNGNIIDEDDIISSVSGVYAVTNDLDGDNRTDDDGECLDDCGLFILRGLEPNQRYRIQVKSIASQFTSTAAIGPCLSGQISGIEEETIATIQTNACGAGESINLDLIDTESTISEEGEASETISACQLNTNATSNKNFALFSLFVGGFLLLQVSLRLKRSR